MDNLKELREAKGWSREELAIRVDVSTQTIWNWQKGKAMHSKYQKKLNKLLY